jgi:hypothetical protein
MPNPDRKLKTVAVHAHEFDCLPGHVSIVYRDSGYNLRVAVRRAVESILSDRQLRGRRVKSFKMSVVVLGME